MLASSSAWIGLVLGVLCAGTEPKSLISQLGSPRFAEREAASEALERLGQEAFPILREARRDRDPEVKNRAEILLESIERTMLTRPTSITLTAGQYPQSRLVEALSRAEGVTIPFEDGGAPGVGPLIEVKSATLPFWEAVDALNLVPRWGADAELDRFGNRREANLRLLPRQGPQLPNSDSGPFRISIARPPSFALEPQGFEAFRPGGGAGARRDAQDLLIPIDILAEPRLGIRFTGPIKIHDAVDDLKQTLIPSNRFNEFDNNNNGGVTPDAVGSRLSTTLRLRSPGQKGKSLTLLRGAIPVEVESRRIEPTIIPIAETGQADHKPLATSKFTLVVQGLVPRQFGLGLALEVTLRPDGWIGPMGRGGGRRNQAWGDQISPDEEQFLRGLEIIDTEGRRFRSEPRGSGGGADGKHFLIDLVPPRGSVNSRPAEVHYYGQGRTPFEISFEFRNVPLP